MWGLTLAEEVKQNMEPQINIMQNVQKQEPHEYKQSVHLHNRPWWEPGWCTRWATMCALVTLQVRYLRESEVFDVKSFVEGDWEAVWKLKLEI